MSVEEVNTSVKALPTVGPFEALHTRDAVNTGAMSSVAARIGGISNALHKSTPPVRKPAQALPNLEERSSCQPDKAGPNVVHESRATSTSAFGSSFWGTPTPDKGVKGQALLEALQRGSIPDSAQKPQANSALSRRGSVPNLPLSAEFHRSPLTRSLSNPDLFFGCSSPGFSPFQPKQYVWGLASSELMQSAVDAEHRTPAIETQGTAVPAKKKNAAQKVKQRVNAVVQGIIKKLSFLKACLTSLFPWKTVVRVQPRNG